MTRRSGLWPLLAAGMLWLALTGPSHALNCTATLGDISFGSYDTLAGNALATTASLDIACTAIAATGVRVCPYLGDGSGGRDSTARYMQGTGGAIAYQLYTDSAHTTVWGNTTFGSYPTVDFTGNILGTATGSTTLTIYGLIFGGQSPVSPGTYLSNFTTADVDIQWGVNLLGLLSCSAGQVLASHTYPTAIASATVDPNCLVSTSNVDFGSHGVLTAAAAATGGVTVQCTPDTGYALGLDNGLTGSGPTARLMTKGAETITYGLYQDGAHTEPWGQGGGLDVSSTGTGADQDYVVYGRVPAQSTPSPGLYQDTVVAGVTY